MLKRRTNGVYTDVDDIKRKSNGSYVLCDFVKTKKNGVWVEVWPIKQTITPTAQSDLYWHYHIYLKTISENTLEAYIGEYTHTQSTSGGAELITTLAFSNLRIGKNLTFDYNVVVNQQTYYTLEEIITMDNDIRPWPSGSSSKNETRSVPVSNNTHLLKLKMNTTTSGWYPTNTDYIKITISNIRNGGQKFVWAYPQTIYETWPHEI